MRLAPIPLQGIPDLLPAPFTEYARAMCEANQAFYRITGLHAPWCSYLAVEGAEVIGTCAFKGPPKNGTVELAYGTEPAHEGRGIATRMAAALIGIARSTDPAVRITAQTFPERNASSRILTKLGFVRAGEAMDDDVGVVWNWELPQGDQRP